MGEIVSSKNRIVLMLFAVLSIVLGVFLFTAYEDPYYRNIYILPLSFGIYLIFLYRSLPRLFGYLVFWIILFQQIIRYFFLPALFPFSDFHAGRYTQNADYAVGMFAFELLVVFIVLKNIPAKKIDYSAFKVKTLRINFKSFSILLFMLGFLAVNTSFIQKLSFVWDLSKYLELKNKGDLDAISPLASITFPIIRMFIFIFIFSCIQRFKIKNKFKVFYSFVLLLLNASIVVGVSRFSIVFASLPLLLIIVNQYPRYRKNILIISAVGFSIVMSIISFSKFAESEISSDGLSGFLSLSQLNAYFGGLINYSIGIDSYFSNNLSMGDRVKYLTSDIFQNIPLLSSFADENFKTLYKFNAEIYGVFGSRDQIVPISISGLFHWSFLSFFIYTVLITFLAFRFESIASMEKRIVLYCLYFTLAFSCSLLMMINLGSLSATLFMSLVIFIPLFKFLYRIKFLQ